MSWLLVINSLIEKQNSIMLRLEQSQSTLTQDVADCQEAQQIAALDCDDVAKCLMLVAKLRDSGEISQEAGFQIKKYVMDESNGAKLRHALKTFEGEMHECAFLRAIRGFMGLIS